MFSLFHRLRDPAIFQGSLERKNYFEGWYFKQSDLAGDTKLSFIPGISLTGKDKHAFIQVIDGLNGEAYNIRYPICEFKPEKDPFAIHIGKNVFSYSGVKLDIIDEVQVKGKLEYTDLSLFKGAPWMRGVMGWYGYVPYMETYHGLLSLDHIVNGSIKIEDSVLTLKNAKGYIEKDWGTSFPSAWIWMQGNCFKENKTSLMVSVAIIPWLGSSFIGHLAVFLYKNKVINLSTYSGGKLTKISKTASTVELCIETSKYRLNVEALQGDTVNLKSPLKGNMVGRTVESLSSSIDVSLYDKKKNIILFAGKSEGSGLEIMDELSELEKGLSL
jgi:tocopherol cyclase